MIQQEPITFTFTIRPGTAKREEIEVLIDALRTLFETIGSQVTIVDNWCIDCSGTGCPKCKGTGRVEL